MSTPVVGWFEITGKNGPAFQQFYPKLFDWGVTDAGSGYGLAEFLEKAEKLGGETVVPPTAIPGFGLTFAFFADPEGHVVGLSSGAVQ